MNNRLTRCLARAGKNKEKLFCAYVMLGYPSVAKTEAVVRVLEQAGTDILELGFPFSDPLADGPTIQYASEHAIRNGVTLEDAFRVVKRLRHRGIEIPILFFSYLNPILCYGASRFVRRLQASGFDGSIVPDLPPEEGKELETMLRQSRLSMVYLIAPTTRRNRMRAIAGRSNGFIYYVSLRGITGARRAVPRDLVKTVKILKRLTRKPVLVGFGISQPEQVRTITRVADGVVVGSAIIDRLRNGAGVPSIGGYISRLVRALKTRR